jgi:hypothetical protein
MYTHSLMLPPPCFTTMLHRPSFSPEVTLGIQAKEFNLLSDQKILFLLI